MKRAYVAHILVAACSPCAVLEVWLLRVFFLFLYREDNTAGAAASLLNHTETQGSLHMYSMPRVHQDSQPATICSEDKTGTLSLSIKCSWMNQQLLKSHSFKNNRVALYRKNEGEFKCAGEEVWVQYMCPERQIYHHFSISFCQQPNGWVC